MPVRSTIRWRESCSLTSSASCRPSTSLLYSLRLSQPTKRTTVWSSRWQMSSAGDEDAKVIEVAPLSGWLARDLFRAGHRVGRIRQAYRWQGGVVGKEILQ